MFKSPLAIRVLRVSTSNLSSLGPTQRQSIPRSSLLKCCVRGAVVLLELRSLSGRYVRSRDFKVIYLPVQVPLAGLVCAGRASLAERYERDFKVS